jgi:hypothetical protein
MSTKPTQKQPETTRQRFALPDAIRVIGTTLPSEAHGREIVLEISTESRTNVSHLSLAEMGAGELKPLAAALAEGEHFNLAKREMRGEVAKAILREVVNSKTVVVDSTGLTKLTIAGQTFTAYVWNRRVYWFGPKPEIEVIASKRGPQARSSGKFDDWKIQHKGVLPGNHYLIVIFAHSFAAAIRGAFCEPELLLALVGASTTGKSTSQNSAQAAIGHPEEVMTMSGTKIGLLDRLASKPDQPAFLQDTRQADSTDDLLKIIFDAADGARRIRSGESTKPISATVILSNERNILDMPLAKKGGLDEGIFARLLEINVNPPNGAFHHLHGEKSAADFAKKLETIQAESYGTAWPAWLKVLSKNWQQVIELHEQRMPKVKAKIVKHAGTMGISSINNRLLDKLTFSAWAGCIASHYGVLPVTIDEVIDAFGLVFTEHLARQMKGMTPLGEKLIAEVRGFLDENHGRFRDLLTFDTDAARGSILGYRFEVKGVGEVYLIFPSVFNRLFTVEFGNVVFSLLKDAEFLVTTPSRGNQYQARIPGTEIRKHFVAIKASIRFDEANA